MSRRSWFIRCVGRSLRERRGRVLTASLSVTVAAAIVVCGLGISLGIRQKLGGELKSYGANVLVTPRKGYLEAGTLSDIRAVPGVEDVAGQFYALVEAGESEIELLGLDMEEARLAGWRLIGVWPTGPFSALAGANLASALGLKAGDAISIAGSSVTITGVVERGGPEDSALIMGREEAARLAGVPGVFSSAFVRARSDAIDATASAISMRLGKAVTVKTVRQVAYAEEAFLGKMELLMALVTIVVLAATGISVTSTMAATVLERIREIGLMKAIGGSSREIGLFFVAEGTAIGLIGGVAGYAIGLGAAQAVAQGAFRSFVHVPPYMLAVSLVIGVGLTVGSSMIPLLSVLRQKPAGMLREE